MIAMSSLLSFFGTDIARRKGSSREQEKHGGGGAAEEAQRKLMGKELQHLSTKQVSEREPLEPLVCLAAGQPCVRVGFCWRGWGTPCDDEAFPEPARCSSTGRVTRLPLPCPVCPVQWLLLTELLCAKAVSAQQ